MSYEYFDKFILAPYKETHAAGGSLNDLMPAISENFGLTDLSDYEREQLETAFAQSMGEKAVASDEQSYLLYGSYEPLTVTLTHILNQKAGLAWTSYSHTGVPVQTFAMGAGSEAFNGYYDNTDIFKKVYGIMIEAPVVSMK